jgi:hypothetical protein
MATLSLTNCEILVGGLDMSSFLNKATLTASAAELDVTTFGQTAVNRIGGLKDTALAWDGFWTSIPESAQFAQLGLNNQVVTVSPQGTEGSVAYMLQAGQFTYSQFGKVGDAAPFSATLAGTDPTAGAVRGQLAALTRSVSGTGQVGSILSLTAPSASQFIYASIHITTAATSATIQVQSAALIGFAGPTTRASFTLTSSTGGQWLVRVPGPITDAFYRFNCSAQVGTYVLSGAIGVQ